MRFGFLARIGAVFVLLAALGAAPIARAAPVLYDFTFTETDVLSGGGSGDFSGRFAVDVGLVIAVTGTTARWGAITGLIAPGVYLGNDNALNPSSPWVTNAGVSFATANNRLNLYQSGNEWRVGVGTLTSTLMAQSEGTLSVTLVRTDTLVRTEPPTQVPAPASLALLVAGLLGLGAARARRRAAPLPA